MDAAQMASLIKRRSLRAGEVVETAIARAEVGNIALKAVICPLYGRARKPSTDPGERPFAGVPFLIKDFGSRRADALHTSGMTVTRLAKHLHRCAQPSGPL